MKIVKNSELDWNYSEKHDMYAGINCDLPSNRSADIIFAKIESGHTLAKHYHERPLDIDGQDVGYESFFFYNGGHIIILGKDFEKEINSIEPFTLTFYSHEAETHGIKNIGETDVEFQVLCAPKFDSLEEYFV